MAFRSVVTVLFLVCALRLARADLVVFPENEAAVAGTGQTIVLRCSSSVTIGARIMWTEFASNELGMVVSDGRGIVPTHPNAARYAIIGDVNNHEFNLQISNVAAVDGGTYLCQDVQGSPPAVFRRFAELVVLETEPQCSDYAGGSGVVMEGSLYSAECEVYVRGNLQPTFEWFGPTGFFLQNGTRSATWIWSWMYFTAVRAIDGQALYHQTEFKPFFAEPGHANNIPTYTHRHNGPVLAVSWPPTTASITPNQPTYQVGDVITCTPDSRPASQVQWQNMRTLLYPPPGPTFTVTADLLGFDQSMRCGASVLIDGSFYSNDFFHNVSVPMATTTPTTTTPGPSTAPPADGPCSIITGRWQSANPSATICFDVDTKGNVFVIIRNGTDLYFVAGRGKTVYNDYRHVGFTAHWPNTGIGGFSGECHSCFGNEVLLFSGLARNKHDSEICGASVGTQLTNLYVFTRSGPACIGMEVDEVRANDPSIVERMGIKAKKITPVNDAF